MSKRRRDIDNKDDLTENINITKENQPTIKLVFKKKRENSFLF